MAAETMAAYVVILGLPVWLVIETIVSRRRRQSVPRTRGRAVAVAKLDDSTVVSRDGVRLSAESSPDVRINAA